MQPCTALPLDMYFDENWPASPDPKALHKPL